MIFYRFKGKDDLFVGDYCSKGAKVWKDITLIPNELLTQKRIDSLKKECPRLNVDKAFEKIDIPKSETHTSFGVTFQNGYGPNGKLESVKRSKKIKEDVYSIIYDFDDEWAGTGTTEEEFEGTWLELQDYIKQLKKNGCYHIDATCISDCYESKKTSRKLRIKEAVGQTLYCVAGFDESEYQSYNGGNLTLVTFKSLGDAKDFEYLLDVYVTDAELLDLDQEYCDVSEWVDDCAGCYTVDIREALNAVDHDNSIIPGFEVVILNQKDIDSHKLLWFENIPDKYYK